MSLTIVLPFHVGDYPQAKNLLAWIGELGGCKGQNLLLVADAKIPVADIKEMKTSAIEMFDDVRAIQVSVPDDRQGWPKACNLMFLKTCEYIQRNYKTPFFWLEPDCIPLKKKWASKLDKAYEECCTKYLGAIIEQTDQPDMPKFHMNGCGVYPVDAYSFFSQQKGCVDGDVPWDIVNGQAQVAATTNTLLLHAFWGKAGAPPIFVKELSADAPENHVLLEQIRPDAYVFHRDKAQNIITLLREQALAGKK